ncbi:unnamed protein product [Durusdinium trenchii]|uniref:Pseudouridine synthase RsuA/RluA-like domain-containing protein n=1 Tax=Durusdinium trenchii TaxID=1381693 RepID=A0ABP0LSI9_9DINO
MNNYIRFEGNTGSQARGSFLDTNQQRPCCSEDPPRTARIPPPNCSSRPIPDVVSGHKESKQSNNLFRLLAFCCLVGNDEARFQHIPICFHKHGGNGAVFREVKMSRVCYVSALASCASSMAWEAALACLTAMQNAQMTPGAVEVGTLAESFNRALGHKAARELLCSVSTSWKAGKKDAVPNFTAEEIIMQGPGLLMANKPEGTSTEEFAAALAARLNCRLSVTSRLDHPTSGVLPLAFGTESSMEKWLVAQLAARLVEKEYLCLCEGEALGPPGTTGLVVAPIRTMELDGHTSRSEVSPTGRIARTEYQVLRRFSCRGAQWAEDTSEVMLLAAHPITGRTHQIRVHFAFLGRPLLGDLTYGRRDSLSVCPRLFLHCRRFSCIGPDGTPLVAEAPLPPELQNVLETL